MPPQLWCLAGMECCYGEERTEGGQITIPIYCLFGIKSVSRICGREKRVKINGGFVKFRVSIMHGDKNRDINHGLEFLNNHKIHGDRKEERRRLITVLMYIHI